tara:strand:+ start:5078 stop:5845 length:768 start_codon:yes stop_codon:yes gene_type:complete
MKKQLVLLFLFIGCGFMLQAQGDAFYQQLFDSANKAYDTKHYEAAVKNYNAILQAGFVGDDIYYNLGNAYYKQGSIPMAILHYEKALKLNPGNKDATFNLKLANGLIVDEIKPIPTIFYKRWWDELRNINTATGWAILAIVCCFLLSGAFFIYRMTSKPVYKRMTFYAFIVFGAFGIFALIMGNSLVRHHKDGSTAIVFEPTLNVMSEPSEKGTALYVIHEGTKVAIQETKENWLKINLPDGNQGWIKGSSIERI